MSKPIGQITLLWSCVPASSPKRLPACTHGPRPARCAARTTHARALVQSRSRTRRSQEDLLWAASCDPEVKWPVPATGPKKYWPSEEGLRRARPLARIQEKKRGGCKSQAPVDSSHSTLRHCVSTAHSCSSKVVPLDFSPPVTGSTDSGTSTSNTPGFPRIGIGRVSHCALLTSVR